MIYKSIDPIRVEDFIKALESNGWLCVLKDAGQPNFIGWGYHYRWEKNDPQTKLDLHFADNQGKQSCHLEISLSAFKILQSFITPYVIEVSDDD